MIEESFVCARHGWVQSRDMLNKFMRRDIQRYRSISYVHKLEGMRAQILLVKSTICPVVTTKIVQEAC